MQFLRSVLFSKAFTTLRIQFDMYSTLQYIHHHSTLSSIDFFRHCLLSMCFVYISSTVIIRYLDDISHTNYSNFDTDKKIIKDCVLSDILIR